MESHDNKFEDMEKPYQENVVDARGVVITVAGLTVVCVVSFLLMWFMQQYLDREAERSEVVSPLQLSEEERLPPEPRLQSAPGFGVDGVDGRVNLQLREPQAEYRVLKEEWEKVWKEGEKDPNTGAVISLSIEEAKKKVLENGTNSTPAKEAQTGEQEKAATAVSGQ